jgi:hypothetical protein
VTKALARVFGQAPELIAAIGLLVGSVIGSELGDLALGAIVGSVIGLGVAMFVTRSTPDGN